MSICCSEHEASMCFSEHGWTPLMNWRSWPEPINRVVDVLQRAYIHLVDSNRRDQPIIGVSKKKDPDPRVPDRGTLQVPARTNPEFGPWNRAPFPKMGNFRQGEPSIFPNMEEFNLMEPTPR
ncbi:hypothetical protein F2Q69_00030749 [Brassica cretica]|uniref:Uncharacterized protein n=1 Tax=Brassica cretica TaxID=69181 RepID=A0A8S9RXC2_BRACR|nr:hypothetical protein F2Q69_00030749 [Brassica cretica]